MKLNLNLSQLQDQLRNLDFKDIANWPMPFRVSAIVILCAAVLGAGFWVDTRGQIEVLEAAQKKEEDLKNVFEEKQRKAANLVAYRAQMDEMKRSFGNMLRQLPSKTQVPELLVDISQTGLAAGLEFELFKPQDEVPAEFYAELPIKIAVSGNYHEFGAFASGVAMLPRIVTIHDVNIAPPAAKDSGTLRMELTAKTYRYLEEGAQ